MKHRNISEKIFTIVAKLHNAKVMGSIYTQDERIIFIF